MYTNYFIIWAVTAVCFLIIDAVWLGKLARDFYFTRLDGLLREKMLIAPALIFYLGYAAAVVALAVRPGAEDQGAATTAALSALLGLTAYGTYNATNYSTLRGWPAVVSIADTAWGACLTCIAGLAGHAMKVYLLA